MRAALFQKASIPESPTLSKTDIDAAKARQDAAAASKDFATGSA